MSYSAFERWQQRPALRPSLSIVIPAYNESIRILPTIGAMAVTISGFGIEWELILSDDGSRDQTPEMVAELGWANLHVLRSANTGKGGAVQRGMMAAKGDLILFADADNSTPIEELPRLLAAIDAGASIAIGSRAAEGASEQNKSPLRQLASNTLRWLARRATGLKTRDTQCGFKLFRKEAAHDLFSRQQLQGFAFDLEILYLARKYGYSVSEVAVKWFDAPGSKVDGWRDGLRFLRDLAVILNNDLSGRYRDQRSPAPLNVSKGETHALGRGHQLSPKSSKSV